MVEYSSASLEKIIFSCWKLAPTLPDPEKISKNISPGSKYFSIFFFKNGIKEDLFPW